ncbi:MAG: glutathione S-transferase family protein [Pseudomonadota bacterium]
MGHLIDGVWTTETRFPVSKSGKFERADARLRNWVTPDGSPGPSGEGGFKAESGRYHLYVANACPWAHRTLIFRALKGLSDHITVDIVHPDMLDFGWTFETDGPARGDSLFGSAFLHEIYTRSDPKFSGRVTVPVLWDKLNNVIVSNESSEIIRMFNSAFDAITGNIDDYWPEDIREDIETINLPIYHDVNNGVYKSGFSTTQAAYDEAVSALFDRLDWIEGILSDRRYLLGDRLTEADWRLFTTLLRFDCVYHLHFKCNRRRLIDYPNLWDYARALYQWPGIKPTVDFKQIVRHYHYSHKSINPNRIIPINPIVDWDAAHGRR